MNEDSQKLDNSNAGSEFSDEEIVKSHVELSKIKHEPTKNFLIAPPGLCLCFWLLDFCLFYSAVSITNSFQLHPPVEVVELTAEEKEALRLKGKFPLVKKYSPHDVCVLSPANGLG